MSKELAVDDGFCDNEIITRSASVPMVSDEKTLQQQPSKETLLERIKPLDICSSRIRRFSSGSMVMSPKISRLSPARLEQIKYEDTVQANEIAHERATFSSLQIAQLLNKDLLCDVETSSDASSSTESSSIAAASSLSSGIQTSGGLSPVVAKFPSPLSVLSPSPPPYCIASSVPSRIRASSRCNNTNNNHNHKRSESPKVIPAFVFSSSANASPASSTASGGAYSPTALTPHNSLSLNGVARPSSLRGPLKRRYDGPSLFYHHTTPSAAIGTGTATTDPESPCQFRKSNLLIPALSGNNNIRSSNGTCPNDDREQPTTDECNPAKIKRPSSLVSSEICANGSETESMCSTPASSVPQGQMSSSALPIDTIKSSSNEDVEDKNNDSPASAQAQCEPAKAPSCISD